MQMSYHLIIIWFLFCIQQFVIFTLVDWNLKFMVKEILLSAFPNDTKNKLTGLFSTLSL